MVSALGESAVIIDMYAPNAKVQAMVQSNADNNADDYVILLFSGFCLGQSLHKIDFGILICAYLKMIVFRLLRKFVVNI